MAQIKKTQMNLYEEAMKLINSSYSFEILRYKVAKMLEKDDIYISADDIQAIWVNKYEDHITIAVYLRSIEINVRIYKDDTRIYTSIYPLLKCEC
jgi:predicted lipid-binding transport protein (Tim44 family)